MPVPAKPISGNFDEGLKDWTAEGSAFLNQPISSAPPSTRSFVISAPAMPLGGDYWTGGFTQVVPEPVGNIGRFWIRTPEGATGYLRSATFTIQLRYLTFLISGSNDNGHRVELQLSPVAVKTVKPIRRDGDWLVVHEAHGDGTQVMCREVWDLHPFVGSKARIRIAAEGATGHISADDFRFQDADPTSEFVAVQGYPGLYDGDTADAMTGTDRLPLWGVADVHCHPMAAIGFGGKLIAGNYEPTDPVTSLGHCESIHGPGGVGSLFFWGFGEDPMADAAFPLTGGHRTGGCLEFDGWPRFTTLIHQTMHWEWIQRAYLGGLRLMCALVVNTEMLSEKVGPLDTDDANIPRQVNFMKAVAAAHSDWMEVAYNPADARRIIRSNKLCIVFGMEFDKALGLWKNMNELPTDVNQMRATIRARLQDLYHNYGIRQINPIHVTNNAFGGCAVYNEVFNVSNHYLRGDYFDVDPQEDVDYRMGVAGRDRGTDFSAFEGYFPPAYDDVPPPNLVNPQTARRPGQVNKQGLSSAGEIAMEEMMRLGMLIDIDHMSQRASERAFAMAELGGRNYPLISAHSSFRELSPRANERQDFGIWPHESEKTASQVDRIRSLGGLVAPITHHGDSRNHAGCHVANDCAGTSKTWAVEYIYAVNKMGFRNVAIGTDRNVLLAAPGPRFGPWAAWGLRGEPNGGLLRRQQADAQVVGPPTGVRYSTPIQDYRFYRFEPANTLTTTREVYKQEERDMWEAIAIWKCGANPDTADQPPGRDPIAHNKIVNLAKGLYAESESQLMKPNFADLLTGNSPWEQRAAFLVRHNLAVTAADTGETQRLVPIFRNIWNAWKAMDGPNAPLVRSTAGRRDFDINLDGVAHYGLLPDFLQELKNIGLTNEEMAPLFRSAEDYIQVWERCDAAKTRI
jgi:microsomal dipeptidase-like Zn-dependent dipeptidase